MRRILTLATIAVLALAGCASTRNEEAPSAEMSAETQVVEEEPQESTPEQLASFVAVIDTEWRAIRESAVQCRMLYVTAESDEEKALEQSCYSAERSTVLNAATYAVEMADYVPPSTMQDLWIETKSAASTIGAVNLDGSCGTDAVPNDSDSCTEALGTLYRLYLDLPTILDKWKPYM